MRNIRTVNLLWEQKFRGAYPVSRYALDNEGTLHSALPRPLEARAFDLTRLPRNGSAEVYGGFSAETLLKLEIGAGGTDALGMTSDDLYLLRSEGKSRFLGERRITYVDASLSADGQTVAAAFSDMSGASFALACGEVNGRVRWSQDSDTALSAIVLSSDGSSLALGAENGVLWRLAADSRPLWEFEQGAPVRALAQSATGDWTAYGTASGSLGLIDEDGTRRWEAQLPGEILMLALSGDGTLCVALSRGPEETGGVQITCLIGSGQVGWEYLSEKRLLSLCLSENGQYLATGARDGTLAVYELIFGEAGTGAGISFLSSALLEERTESGDFGEACRLLRAHLEQSPADTEACEKLQAVRVDWEQSLRTELLSFAGAPSEALALLESARAEYAEDLWFVTVFGEARRQCTEQLRAEAEAALSAGDLVSAEGALQGAITQMPLRTDLRQELAALRTRRAQEARAEADRLLASGDIEASVVALEKALAAAPSSELAAELAALQTQREFAEGMAFYDARQYPEAIFQFQKVLAQVPDHAEARRYLGFAQKFAQDSTDRLNDRFSRLE